MYAHVSFVCHAIRYKIILANVLVLNWREVCFGRETVETMD